MVPAQGETLLRSHRITSLVVLFLAGAVLVLPFRGLAVLARSNGSEFPLKRLAVRSANRLRSTGVLAPRLPRSESALDGGRKRTFAPVHSSWPLPSPSPSPGSLDVPDDTGTRLTVFPLRC